MCQRNAAAADDGNLRPVLAGHGGTVRQVGRLGPFVNVPRVEGVVGFAHGSRKQKRGRGGDFYESSLVVKGGPPVEPILLSERFTAVDVRGNSPLGCFELV